MLNRLKRQHLWILIAGLLPTSVYAQSNGSSLTERDELRTVIGMERLQPVRPCETLISEGGVAFSVISAEESEPAGFAAVCRVHAVIPQDVEFMLELPRHWNGRLYTLGNGGYGGESVTSDYGGSERTRAHELGFTTLITNLGHDRVREPGTSWARNNFAKKIDYGFRALHASTLVAKELIAAYYGQSVHRSYFDGCSTGGGEALKEAQRFPQDYDGILGGAPVFDFVRLQLYGWNNQMAILKSPLDPAKVAFLGRVIMERYDALDGLRDGVIGNPMAIHFDPRRDLPRAAPGREGFTPAEIAALARIYGGVIVDGKQLAPGVPVGAEPLGQTYLGQDFSPGPRESGWATRLIPDSRGYMQQRANVDEWLKYLAFEQDEPAMDILHFDLRRDLPRLRPMSRIMDATDPNLEGFRARGGKLILYHGWADTGVNPLITVRYYERVLRRMGTDTPDFFRLFIVPGMFHCRGGLNVDRFDGMTAVIRWVERGRPPAVIVAARVVDGKQIRTRPLCPFPQVARYSGHGSTDEAHNFTCTRPDP